MLADTNILARIAQPSHHQNQIARQALEKIRLMDHHLCVVPQVVYEFWTVATRPFQENGLGMNVRQVLAELANIRSLFQILRDERAIF